MTQIDDLAVRLGIAPAALAALAACSEEEVSHLLCTIDDALAAADHEVEQGLEHTLAAVPRPLRGRARALLFPRESS